MYRSLKATCVLLVVLLATLAGTTIALAAPARNGVCDSGEVCFYYNSNRAGSLSDVSYPLASYGTGSACNHFLGAGNGKGLCLKNNAASVWNRTGQSVRVYYNSNYGGLSQDFAAGVNGNLNANLKNENASHQLLGGSQPPAPPSIGLLAPDKDGLRATPPFLFTYYNHNQNCGSNRVVHDDLLTAPWKEDRLFKVQPWTIHTQSKSADGSSTLTTMYQTAVSKERVVTFCTNNTNFGTPNYYTTLTPQEYVYRTQVTNISRSDGGVGGWQGPVSAWKLGIRP